MLVNLINPFWRRDLVFRQPVLALVFASFVTVSAVSQETSPAISIVSMEIPKAYTPDGDGVYNRVFNELVKGYDGEIDIGFYPSARYNRIMSTRGGDCDYIATDNTARWQSSGVLPDELEFIGPINQLHVVAYIPIDAEDVRSPDDLKGLSLASDVNLLDTIHSLGIKETFALQSQPQMLSLLAVNRIEAMIGYDFDLDFLSREMDLTDKVKKASVRLSTVSDGLVCFKTERTEQFRAHVRERFKVLSDSGWLADAFADY